MSFTGNMVSRTCKMQNANGGFMSFTGKIPKIVSDFFLSEHSQNAKWSPAPAKRKMWFYVVYWQNIQKSFCVTLMFLCHIHKLQNGGFMSFMISQIIIPRFSSLCDTFSGSFIYK